MQEIFPSLEVAPRMMTWTLHISTSQTLGQQREKQCVSNGLIGQEKQFIFRNILEANVDEFTLFKQMDLHMQMEIILTMGSSMCCYGTP